MNRLEYKIISDPEFSIELAILASEDWIVDKIYQKKENIKFLLKRDFNIGQSHALMKMMDNCNRKITTLTLHVTDDNDETYPLSILNRAFNVLKKKEIKFVGDIATINLRKEKIKGINYHLLHDIHWAACGLTWCLYDEYELKNITKLSFEEYIKQNWKRPE